MAEENKGMALVFETSDSLNNVSDIKIEKSSINVD